MFVKNCKAGSNRVYSSLQIQRQVMMVSPQIKSGTGGTKSRSLIARLVT